MKHCTRLSLEIKRDFNGMCTQDTTWDAIDSWGRSNIQKTAKNDPKMEGGSYS